MKRTVYDTTSRRQMVLSTRGMVAASNPLAAQAGLAILRKGGNAADAAIAAAAVINVTDPASTGIGGDCFALYFDAQTKHITALNGSGRAPANLTLDDITPLNGDIPPRSPHAVTVPGAVMGWYDLLRQHGTMSLKEVLTDAIFYAREGFPVAPIFGESWRRTEPFLQHSPNTEDYLPAPCVGELKKLPGLARTLEMIADGGPYAFYKGKVAEAIVETLQSLGGKMTLDDLAEHHSTWDEPISTTYRGVTVYECPPNGQGLTALLALNIAEGWQLDEFPSPERLHLMVEAMRLAFADARQYLADPRVSEVPTAALLDKSYAAGRRNLVSPDSAMQPPSFGLPMRSSDTIYLCVVDGEGNGCSFINSLYMGWGTGIVAKGTGVFLQNRGSNFSLDPSHPNVLAPRKRPYHTIIPGLATRDGELWATFGVMGGFMQPQGHFQVLSAMIDDGENPQDALDRPRFCLVDGTGSSILALEEGIPVKTMARLAELGHTVQPVAGIGRAVFGGGQIIRRSPENGVLMGGSDPRKDGLVAAF